MKLLEAQRFAREFNGKKGRNRVKYLSEFFKDIEGSYYQKYDNRVCAYRFGSMVRLFSYDTLVAEFDLDDLVLKIHGRYSQTTQKHLFDFIDNVMRFLNRNVRTYYLKLFQDENLKSGADFLRNIRKIDFKREKYSLRHSDTEWKI